MKVVLDTNVVVDHICAKDVSCSAAVNAVRCHRHFLLVCNRLLKEYRGVLCKGDQQMYAVIDKLLLQMFPIELMQKYDDPRVRIEFGPLEDRFHMQLAIDAGANYHVTKDAAVLAEATKMQRFNVRETHPRRYVDDCTRPTSKR